MVKSMPPASAGTRGSDAGKASGETGTVRGPASLAQILGNAWISPRRRAKVENKIGFHTYRQPHAA